METYEIFYGGKGRYPVEIKTGNLKEVIKYAKGIATNKHPVTTVCIYRAHTAECVAYLMKTGSKWRNVLEKW